MKLNILRLRDDESNTRFRTIKCNIRRFLIKESGKAEEGRDAKWGTSGTATSTVPIIRSVNTMEQTNLMASYR